MKVKKLFGIKLSRVLLIVCGILVLLLVGCKGKNSDAGYYVLDSVSSEGQVMDKELLKLIGLDDSYVILKEDGTGRMCLVGEVIDLKWSDGNITIEGVDTEYTIKGDELTFSVEGDAMVFKRSKDTPSSK